MTTIAAQSSQRDAIGKVASDTREWEGSYLLNIMIKFILMINFAMLLVFDVSKASFDWLILIRLFLLAVYIVSHLLIGSVSELCQHWN